MRVEVALGAFARGLSPEESQVVVGAEERETDGVQLRTLRHAERNFPAIRIARKRQYVELRHVKRVFVDSPICTFCTLRLFIPPPEEMEMETWRTDLLRAQPRRLI